MIVHNGKVLPEVHLAANRNKYSFGCYVAKVDHQYFYHTATVKSKVEIRLMAILWACNYINDHGRQGTIFENWKAIDINLPAIQAAYPELCRRIKAACEGSIIISTREYNRKLTTRCWAEINPVKPKREVMGGHLAFGKGETHAAQFDARPMPPDDVEETRQIMKGLRNGS